MMNIIKAVPTWGHFFQFTIICLYIKNWEKNKTIGKWKKETNEKKVCKKQNNFFFDICDAII